MTDPKILDLLKIFVGGVVSIVLYRLTRRNEKKEIKNQYSVLDLESDSEKPKLQLFPFLKLATVQGVDFGVVRGLHRFDRPCASSSTGESSKRGRNSSG